MLEEFGGITKYGLEIEVILFVILVLGILFYTIYYYFFIVDDVKTKFQPTEFNDFLVERCPTLREHYYPPFWLFSSHLQGSLGLILRNRYKINYESETIIARDGAELMLNWAKTTSNKKNAPVMLILPGVTGGRDKPYITHFVKECQQRGWRAVVLIFPGCLVDGDTSTPCKTPRFFSPIDVSDIIICLSAISKKFPKAPIIGVGHSMGANMLVKYLGTVGKRSQLTACISLSNPWNWEIVGDNLERGSLVNKTIVSPHFASYWLNVYKKNYDVFKKCSRIDHGTMIQKKNIIHKRVG